MSFSQGKLRVVSQALLIYANTIQKLKTRHSCGSAQKYEGILECFWYFWLLLCRVSCIVIWALILTLIPCNSVGLYYNFIIQHHCSIRFFLRPRSTTMSKLVRKLTNKIGIAFLITTNIDYTLWKILNQITFCILIKLVDYLILLLT